MTTEEMAALWEKHNDQFLMFEQVKNPLSGRPDINAFLLLDQLVSGSRDIISSAEHDEIWVNIDVEKLAEVIVEEQIIELIRCGVRYDSAFDSLAMFV